MVSDDFRALMRKIHAEGSNVVAAEVDFRKVNEGFTAKVTIELERGLERESFHSVESDVLEYAHHLQNVVRAGGEVKLAPVRNLNQYFLDIDHLVDQDNSKLRTSLSDLRNRRFKFRYDPDATLEEMLRSARPVAKRFLPMKKDYHRILAYYVLHSQNVLSARRDLIEKRPHAKRFVDSIEEILRVFRVSGSPIKDFLAYRDYADFDLNGLARRLRAQSRIVDRTIQDLVKKGSVPIEESIPRLLEIYKTVVEIMSPVLNVVRVALDMHNGVARPRKQKGLTENLLALRTDSTYGPLFDCLEPNLRHADAHAAYETEGELLRILDHRGKKARVIQEMPLDRVSRVVWEAHQALFPAVLNAFALQEITMKDLVITCREFSFLLLAVGNS